MKRLLSTLLVLLMLFGSTLVVVADSNVPITLRFAWWGGDERTAATLAVIEQFEAIHPHITIEAEYGGSDGYHDKLATQLASGTAADIVQIDPETMPTYVATGDYFLDYGELGFNMSNFDSAYIGQQINGNYDGRQLGLPTGIAGAALVVNRDLAEKFGIDFNAPYTWDDMLAWGKKVQEADPEVYLLCTNKDYLTSLVVITYLKQLGGASVFNPKTKEMNVNFEDMQRAFKLIEDLYANAVLPPATYSAAYGGDNLQSDPNWVSGKYLCTFAHISTINVMTAANPNANYTVGTLPVLANANETGWGSNTPQLMAITRTSKHPEAALAFMDYFFNNEVALETLGSVRSVPPTAKARKISAAVGKLDPLMMEAANIVSALAGTTNDKYISTREAKQILADNVELVGYGSESAATAADHAISDLEEYIQAQ